MAFDQQTRKRLSDFVECVRVLLAEEFTRQLQQDYGLDPTTGDVADLDRLAYLDDTRRETARILRATLDHYLAGAPIPPARTAQEKAARQEALGRIVREQAFTVLNRLCALRMAEARGLLIDSIAGGYGSRGFQLYARLAGTALGETGDAYRCYLHSVFDELAVDLPVLFDRWSPQGRLFPRETTLLRLLDAMNHPEIDALWAEDETIGWIYQYFNSKDERKAMRDASQAPRNSRELAVRNQFFTPRYVVEFLTDNTLGRIWYEMTRGQTGLADSCRYLVRRPREEFLAEGEQPPAQDPVPDDLSQEELLKQPVSIPHRPLKDPREITMLDPACGSMHFGLYAFDLFERIYEEAWELEEAHGPEALGRSEVASLHGTYPDREAFLRDVPRLIVERNIHGIDIDPRAVQIAGLSLWLRAQRSWQAQGLRPGERPAIRRSNIVCAEPMPGESALLDEFTASLEPPLIGQLVRKVFACMALAGEAGSLLKIEDELHDAIARAHQQARRQVDLAQDRRGNSLLFTQPALDAVSSRPTQASLFNLAGVELTDAQFWTNVEARVLAALSTYAQRVTDGQGLQRALFADDAARGFAFVDLCRQHFDVVLMNPPFGAASLSSRSYVERAYPRTKNDIYAAFVERGVDLLWRGSMLGAITSRTGFFLTSFQRWREEILLKEARPTVMADLGQGVLDAAMVETAAYCLETK